MTATLETTLSSLCADGYVEYVARTEYEAEPRGARLGLAGDAMRFERDSHSTYCLGCPICFNPVLDADY